jgi:hypothetical protein
MDNEYLYCSYLLRIWVEPANDHQQRFSLEDTLTGKRMGFTSLEKMTKYLEQIINEECRDIKED